MKCSLCTQHTPDDWQLVGHVGGSGRDFTSLSIEWMRCANPDCQQAVIRMNEMHMHVENNQPVGETVTWLARPRAVGRAIDPLVKEPFRTDYLEAAAILDLTPRMSAVLSRRILADLLEEYAGLKQFGLKERIDEFSSDISHPSQLRENLHHFREIANFGAHTQKDDQAEILEVERGEAEWTLDLLDRLFELHRRARERSKDARIDGREDSESETQARASLGKGRRG